MASETVKGPPPLRSCFGIVALDRVAGTYFEVGRSAEQTVRKHYSQGHRTTVSLAPLPNPAGNVPAELAAATFCQPYGRWFVSGD